jgi:hypothetical protein
MASATFMTIANRTIPMGAEIWQCSVLRAHCAHPQNTGMVTVQNSRKSTSPFLKNIQRYQNYLCEKSPKKGIIKFIFEGMGHCLPLTIGLTLPRAGFLESFYHTDMSSFLRFTEMNTPICIGHGR